MCCGTIYFYLKEILRMQITVRKKATGWKNSFIEVNFLKTESSSFICKINTKLIEAKYPPFRVPNYHPKHTFSSYSLPFPSKTKKKKKKNSEKLKYLSIFHISKSLLRNILLGIVFHRGIRDTNKIAQRSIDTFIYDKSLWQHFWNCLSA